MADPVSWDQGAWVEGKLLAMAAYNARVADVVSHDIMWYQGKLVIVDTEEIFERDDCLDYGIALVGHWRGG